MVKITKGGKEVKDMSEVKLPEHVIRIIKSSIRN